MIQELYNRAKIVIPGGNSLLSKRPEMFLPNGWPTYFESTSKIEIKDIEGRIFKDFSIMGVGTNILGYSNEQVDSAVMEVVRKGNLSSLNCAEEVYLAEKMLDLNPWASSVKYARTGGEANAIAVRIARAAAKRDVVGICGYHGWHDWYLASNLSSPEALTPHLLEGLSTSGVPKSLGSNSKTFQYGDFGQFDELLKDSNLGVVIMEVARSAINIPFLEYVRKKCSEKEIILIFDECTSGFRETQGGLHSRIGVNPDLAMFGKALGNGYAINMVLGSSQVMRFAQDSFISSTFWSERIGPTAALATLKEMEAQKSWEKITQFGRHLRGKLDQVFTLHKVPVTFAGLIPLVAFTFNSKNNLKYKTFITQEMLKKNYLAANLFILSVYHSENEIDEFITLFEPIIQIISECENLGRDIDLLLEYPICQSGFQRLN